MANAPDSSDTSTSFPPKYMPRPPKAKLQGMPFTHWRPGQVCRRQGGQASSVSAAACAEGDMHAHAG